MALLPDISMMFAFLTTEWWGILALVIGAGFAINTLLYMFAYAFSFQSMKNWCKSEYMQLLVTVLLVSLLVAFVQTAWRSAGLVTELTLSNVAGVELAPGESASPFDISKRYLMNLAECERHYYAMLYFINFGVEKAANFGQDVTGGEPLGMWYLTGFVSLMHYINGMIVYALMLQYLQYRALDYMFITMLQLWLPLGLVLRAFPYTRGAGGFIIAFAIGFFFVYPLSFMIIISLPGSTFSCGDEFFNQIRAENELRAQKPICPDYTIADSEIARAQAKGNIAADQSGAWGWIYEHSWGYLVDKTRDRVIYMLLQSFFYPIIALTVTFTFIRQTGSLFGADLAEIGRGLIKLI